MRHIGLRLATLALLGVTAAGVGGLLAARPASAHAQLLGSDPRADSTVTTPLDEITLSFNELIRGNFSTVVLTAPDGTRHGAGQPRAVDKRVHLPVQPVRSGNYRVAYRVVSADGHPIEGQFRFTVALPPALEPAPVSAGPNPPSTSGAAPAPPTAGVASGDSAAGAGPWWAGAAVVGATLVAAVLVLVRRRRRVAAR
ncbi:hypothetical protein GCM10022225_64790 [Plantactinospora mayteni]|uniref:CopC domain-containing protein n=1 Tax=Plantactinospora mayteni TaxID=566021 RepID=A0ABQ4F0M8_9ACTN|nr:copper resistance CopC family protein [Plantactinospora mayteni]GIH00450.1 hypothetical protein Pma05_70220 [Plantactinospora mayteni]